MSLKPEVIDALVAAGCTAEQIAAAIKADMSSRSKAAERQRRYRERHKASQSVTRDVTDTSRDAKKEAVSPTPPSEEKNISPHSPPTGAHTPQRATRLARDWTLPSEWMDWSLKEGWPAERVAFEADKFRDYWHGAGGQKARKVDWFATWRNWMRKVPKTRANDDTAEQTKRDRDSIMRALADELDNSGPASGFS